MLYINLCTTNVLQIYTKKKNLSHISQAAAVHSQLQTVTIKYTEDIQIFGVNMTFISSSEVKKCIFHECRRHELNILNIKYTFFFTSPDEIKVIFTTNI